MLDKFREIRSEKAGTLKVGFESHYNLDIMPFWPAALLHGEVLLFSSLYVEFVSTKF